MNSTSDSTIMVVDDNPINLKLLDDLLGQAGYAVRSFPRGRMALKAAGQHPPDLILLDINMPEMTGYEVCEGLKSDHKLADIPVIFLSALNETDDKVKALRCGGVDYISKPFQVEEVMARVETHLKLYRFQRESQLQNQRLEEAVAARTAELAEANRRLRMLDASKNDFLYLISHEFRTPLNGLLGVGELVLNELADSPDTIELREMFDQSRRRILSILDDAMLLTQIDVQGESMLAGPVELGAALRQAVGLTRELAESRQVKLRASGGEAELVVGEQELLVRALHALLETAVKFSGQGERVEIGCTGDGEPVVVTIDSHGKSIPADQIPKFFDLFSMTEASTPGGDLGMGPRVAQRILALFGGTVTVENREGPGVRLRVALKTRDAGGREEAEVKSQKAKGKSQKLGTLLEPAALSLIE